MLILHENGNQKSETQGNFNICTRFFFLQSVLLRVKLNSPFVEGSRENRGNIYKIRGRARGRREGTLSISRMQTCAKATMYSTVTWDATNK